MSELILVIPAGWRQVPSEVVNIMGPSYVAQWVLENNFPLISDQLREHWVDAPDGISQAMYFNGEMLIVK